MTLAWYGHLKFKAVPLVIVILVSWGIAFVEYCFAVPANRFGSAVYSPAELKTMQRRRKNRPEAAPDLDAPEHIADRQYDIGDDGDPERVFGDEGNCHEFANDGQRRQYQRDHGDRCRRGC
jgi:hypothetical protein